MIDFKKITGALIGNSMQFYDFTIYAFLSKSLSNYYFNFNDAFFSYFITTCVFAIGYLTRPLGAIIFGHIGDKFGRSHALSKTILISTCSTFLIGILPTYSSIGLSAPLILILLRLLQGIAVSGEEGGAVVLLFEKNNFNKTGLIGALVLSSVLFGVVIGSFTCFISTYLISKKILGEWAWRIPFLFALPFGILALKLRYSINDFELFKEKKQTLTLKIPLFVTIKKHYISLFFGISIVSIYSISTSTFIINFPYIFNQIGIRQDISLLVTTLSLSLTCLLSPFLAKICEKYNQIVIFNIASGLLCILFPISFHIISYGYLSAIISASLLISILIALISSTIFSILVKKFPFEVRYTGVSLSFNTSITIFSSSTPLILIFLENKFNQLYFSGLYISLITILMILISNKCLILSKDHSA